MPAPIDSHDAHYEAGIGGGSSIEKPDATLPGVNDEDDVIIAPHGPTSRWWKKVPYHIPEWWKRMKRNGGTIHVAAGFFLALFATLVSSMLWDRPTATAEHKPSATDVYHDWAADAGDGSVPSIVYICMLPSDPCGYRDGNGSVSAMEVDASSLDRPRKRYSEAFLAELHRIEAICSGDPHCWTQRVDPVAQRYVSHDGPPLYQVEYDNE